MAGRLRARGRGLRVSMCGVSIETLDSQSAAIENVPGGQLICGSLRRRRIADFFDRGGTIPERLPFRTGTEESKMNSVIYLIGLVVVVLAILSFLGLN